MNIEDKSAIRECTSCQMCAAVCPKDAIRIELDKYGFYRPVVDNSRCVDCGVCLSVCYRFDGNVRLTTSDEIEQAPLYAASAKDDALVSQVTSGGVADLLAKELIKEGYCCIGVGYDDRTIRAYHYAARTSEETDGFRGSKYIQSYTFPAFKELVNGCRNQRYAVFGTPCQIYAVHRFLEKKNLRDQCVLIDLYCHGCPSLHVWRKYQSEVKEKIRKPSFDKVDFRSKERGWGGFYVVVVVIDGVKAFVSSPGKDEFYELFFSDLVLNAACSDCLLRSTLSYTDIRLGDFWGKKYALNSRGVSAVSLCSKRGEDLFMKIIPSMNIEKCRYSELLPYQSYGRKYHPEGVLRTKLLDIVSDEDLSLKDAVDFYHKHQNLQQRIKRHIKKTLYYFPASLTRIIKRFVS